MKSFLLQELTRLILPLALMMGCAFLLKGHDQTGGGFVAGLSLAVAGILGFTAYGTRAFAATLPFRPERVAILGALLLMGGIVVPALAGAPPLTQAHGTFDWLPLISIPWQTTLVFELGVVLSVGGGLASAAAWLWDLQLQPTREP